MKDKQVAELKFWVDFYNVSGLEGFREQRIIDFKEKMGHFTFPRGNGLDLGSGPVTVFDHTSANVIAADPLMDAYLEHIPFPRTKPHIKEDGENLSFPDNHFSWVMCVNVIDHTPDPMKLAYEIYRVLKPRGKLLFEVNFDDQLAAPHYFLWTVDEVRKHMSRFTLKQEWIERNPDYPQSKYYAIYTK